MKVWIEEEYGYADLVWEPEFKTEKELYDWWDSLDKKTITVQGFGTLFNPDETPENVSVTDLVERLEARYEDMLPGGKVSLKVHSQMSMEDEDWETARTELTSCDHYMLYHEPEDSFLAPVAEPIETEGE